MKITTRKMIRGKVRGKVLMEKAKGKRKAILVTQLS